MTKTLNIVLSVVAFIIFLIIGTLIFVATTVDPNDYRDNIESTVETSTGLQMKIEGGIEWSFYPWLGFQINEVQVKDPENTPFTKVKTVQAKVDFVSLLKKSPNIAKLGIDGFSIELIRDKNGKANWEGIKSEHDEAKPPKKRAGKPEPSGQPPQSLQFFISEVSVTNVQVHFKDEQRGTEWKLSPLNAKAENIQPGKTFPLSMQFTWHDLSNDLTLEGDFATKVDLPEDLSRFALSPLTAEMKLKGKSFGNQVVPLTAQTQLVLDKKAQTLKLENTTVQLANIQSTAHLEVKKLDQPYPQIRASLEVAPFSLKSLMEKLGKPPLKTANPSALERLAMKVKVASNGAIITIPKANIQVDDTLFKSKFELNRATSRILGDLQANAFNADDYLPPKVAGKTTSPPEETTPPVQKETELPINLLKSLNLHFTAGLSKLQVNQLQLENLELVADAQNGVLKLEEASGQLYGGAFHIQSTLDANQTEPKWTLTEQLDSVTIKPILADLSYPGLGDGKVSLHTSLSASGKTVSELKNGAKGQASFSIDEALLERINLKALACQGVAKLLGKKVDTSSWPQRTQFESLKGNLQINGPALANPQLIASMAGIALEGEGQVDTTKTLLDYTLGLKILGELGDPACKVNKYLKEISIPVKCSGDFSRGSPQCGLDTEKLGKVMQGIVKKEAEKKLDKLLDKKLDKLFNKKDENANSQEGDNPQSEQTEKKDVVKGLIKGLFK